MSSIVKNYEGNSENTVLLKGAPERVIAKCSTYLSSHNVKQDLSDSEKQALIKSIQQVAGQGYRVLACAIGLDGGNMKHITEDNAKEHLVDTATYDELESGLSFVGYVCIKDPVRPEVAESIARCRTAGINVIMITGDSKETAIAIARELNILKKGQDTTKSCFTGAEFE